MIRDKKIVIAIIIVLLICIAGLGIAFAAFSQTLTIGGSGTVDASSWSVVFEGMSNQNTIGAPTKTGTAQEITRPTIKNNSTEISTYDVSLKTPGDSIVYKFKIHNKGDFAADLTSLTVAGVDRPVRYVSGSYLVSDYSSIPSDNRQALSYTEYTFYYTKDNILVGQYPARDCLEPGESVNVAIKIKFGSTTDTYTGMLPSSDVVLDNLGISAVYTQTTNGSCQYESGTTVVNEPFRNNDRSYYTYEGKSFIGTGVDDVIVTEKIIGKAKYASAKSTQCSDGSTPTIPEGGYYMACPEGTTPIFADHPAKDMAEAYCTGCRLMTKAEGSAWCPSNWQQTKSKCASTALWFLAEAASAVDSAYRIDASGGYGEGHCAIYTYGVRPAVSIPSTATMTGSGTKTDPYVISIN